MTTQTQRDAVADIIRKLLDDKFGDTIAFDQIIVKDAVDIVDGMEYLNIMIIFDGDRKLLDPKWTVGLTGRIRRKMAKLDMHELPVYLFAEKSEWEALLAGEYYEYA
ncbi:MAG: hypothetical protein OXC95_06730 [Dehalococcoidia bacterium]|nr:hypothetical protein [Dehalococcoidia bacterium]